MTARKVHSFRADHDVEEILGSLDKAMSNFKKVIDLTPQLPEGYKNL